MEIYQIYKETAIKRNEKAPKKVKFSRRNFKIKQNKRVDFGTFDPNGYMDEQEAVAGPSGTCRWNSVYNPENENAERDLMYIDDDDSS